MIRDTFPLFLTFDIDWAPNFMIRKCMDLCDHYNVKATFFATHDTPLLDSIKEHPLFELGIHPNFMPHSSHGDTPEEILAHCHRLVPDAQSMRTHCLFQYSNLMDIAKKICPDLNYDVSIYLPHHLELHPFPFSMDGLRTITRIPFQWEDDIYMVDPSGHNGFLNAERATYKIFNFHPIHVYLNSQSLISYTKMKESLGSKKLLDVQEKDTKDFIDNGTGIETTLLFLLKKYSSHQFFKINEINQSLKNDFS